VHTPSFTGLGGMDAGTKRTWMYLQRPEKEGVCMQVRLRDLNIKNVKFFDTKNLPVLFIQ